MLCVDIGSTFTKVLAVDLDTATLVDSVSAPTWASDDVGDAVATARSRLAALDPRAADAPVLACSSAGGGLGIAVLGNEELVTAEAGRRVALSSGGRVVGVVATSEQAGLTERVSAALATADVVLLTGGTDGGNPDALVRGATALVDAGWAGPVVVAGNAVAVERTLATLESGAISAVAVDNVVPRIGVLAPHAARLAIRAMFLEHVIGGKGLSADADLLAAVRGATPDLVLRGVEVLAEIVGEVAVVDIGGSTSDVYSVRPPDPEDAGLAREVVATGAASRTVEADLGMRHSAPGVLEADDPAARAARAGAGAGPGEGVLAGGAERRRTEPGWVVSDAADDAGEWAVEIEIARRAAGTAVRRHAGRSTVVLAPDGRVVERTGVDLREVGLLIGSGGVLRHGGQDVADRVLAELVVAHDPDGWQLPQRARSVVDQDYLLVAIGLLADTHPEVARRLAVRIVPRRSALI